MAFKCKGLTITNSAGTSDDINLTNSSGAMVLDANLTVEGTFQFGDAASDTLTMFEDAKLLFRDSGIYLQSSADGVLDIVSDTTIAMSGAITMDGSISLTGDTTTGILMSGAASSVAINITGSVAKALRMGSYGTRLTALSGVTTEVCTLGLLGEEDDFYIGYGSYLRTTGEDGKGFGASFLVEATNTTGTPTLQGMQCMAFLGSVGGSEAAHLKTLGGDATAGMYAGWFKIGANVNCVCDSGSRVAVLWVDSQMSGTLSGEEYAIFATTGGSKPDAFIGFETTSSGWASLLSFDETSYDQDPVVSGDCSAGGSKDYHLKVNMNGTMYGIQLYSL